MAMPAKELTGQRFGFLTVLSRSGTSGGITKKARWLCQCDCGQQVIRESQYLRSKHRLSPRHCGCQHGNKQHAMTKTRPYQIWVNMRRRCTNPLDKDWKNYGARGITVCASWAQSFASFWEDMQSTYHPDRSLDRIDNNGSYCKQNCRWATNAEQSSNTRKNVWLDTPQGRMTIQQAAEQYALNPQTLRQRVNRGWPLLEALTRAPSRASRTEHGRWSTTSRTAAPETAS